MSQFVGPLQLADDKLAKLQGRDKMTAEERKNAELLYQAHKNDFVARIIGGNKPTGGVSENLMVVDWVQMFGGAATVHSCYGAGNAACSDKTLWGDGNKPNWIKASDGSYPFWRLDKKQ